MRTQVITLSLESIRAKAQDEALTILREHAVSIYKHVIKSSPENARAIKKNYTKTEGYINALFLNAKTAKEILVCLKYVKSNQTKLRDMLNPPLLRKMAA